MNQTRVSYLPVNAYKHSPLRSAVERMHARTSGWTPATNLAFIPFGFSGDSHTAALVSRICGPGRLPATAWSR